MDINIVLEQLEKNYVEFIQEVWYQSSTKEYHVISKFPNGRFYVYINALAEATTPTGSFKNLSDAVNSINEQRPHSKKVWEKADQTEVKGNLNLIYTTNFYLTDNVLDYEAAKNFLVEDNMEIFAKCDERIPKEDRDKIEKITWILLNEEKGIIEVKANDYISNEGLVQLSDWIHGQCSDGLGESFEQQDFANYTLDSDDYYDRDEEDWDGFDEDWHMASFDWQSNDYELILQE